MIDTGTVWKYKGHTYIIHDSTDLRVKDPNDGNWYDAVMYSREDRSITLRFVRRLDDFLTKFTPAGVP